ncbi:MAG: lytic transglycosylase domain-containing protein [Acidobacteria bacterium]|nr:lytic transglycosylase domain-containing protein [Acidobacteriota bacterium]
MRPLLLAFAACAFAAEEIVLHNGFRLQAVRVETFGEKLLLHTATGTVEINRADVAEIEALPEEPKPVVVETPPPPPPPAPAAPEKPKTPKDLLRDAADQTGLPPEFLLSIAKVESAFQPSAISPKGAIGVMQLMPATAKALNANPYDTRENIEAGARLMRDLLVKYEAYPDQVYRALSAYNAGPGAVQKYNGVPPNQETRQYVEKVLNEYHRLKVAASKTENR